MKQHKTPIIGQECICPDGLGRVVAFSDKFPHLYIKVSTYVGDRQCEWSPDNVQLIDLPVSRTKESEK